jgi:prepilin-type N-terminal cleavage/methylation domain-containing protein
MNRQNTGDRRTKARGFTLIELLIVVGIISLLLVVLAVAVLPALAKGDENATKALLQQVGPAFTGRTPMPTIDRFKRDAGQLSTRISGNERVAYAQMMLFYMAPTRETWDGSNLYKNSNYAPKVDPKEFAEFTRQEGGQLPYLVDAWDEPLRYMYDTQTKTEYVWSHGPDKMDRTEDDLIFNGSSAQVVVRGDVQ